MKKTKSLFARIAGLSLTLLLAGGFANAQCTTQVGNYSSCATQFLSISSDYCSVYPYGYSQFTITVTVNQPGATYAVYPGYNATVISSSVSGTTLTYVLRTAYGATGAGLAVHMTGSCSNNFVSINIQ